MTRRNRYSVLQHQGVDDAGILQTMKELNKELNTTFIFSTHDEKVMQYLDRIIHLEDGMVAKDELMDAKAL